jgi:regulator of replication initiation timing
MSEHAFDDLIERFRVLEIQLETLQAGHAETLAENAALQRELDLTRARLAYHQSLNVERFGFEPTAPPGRLLHDEK